MPTPPSPTPQLPLKKGISLRWLPIGFILLQSLLYGFGDPISKSAYEVLPVYSLLTARYGIALVFLLLLFGRRIFQGLRACSLLGLGYALLSFAAIFFFAPQMALLFLNPGEEALIGYTAQYITTLGAFFFPLALVNILRFSIQGMGFSNLAILAGVMEMFARMGVATLLVPAIGYTGACFASPAAWICADLFLIPASCWSIAHLRRVYGQPGERSGSPAP